MKKVLVTGCFDLLHSGHIAFLNEAATLGEVYVGLGSDDTVYELKGRYPINNQDERKFMLEALKSVKKCIINTGNGIIDFEETINVIKPDIFFVNEDGNTPLKEKLIEDKGITYIVSQRKPFQYLPKRSTTSLRTINAMPYRIDLAGGWLDQPFVSKYHPGPVLTISIEPTIEFNERSGMASSTRQKAIDLWSSGIPAGDPQKLAKILFSYDNPPGTKEFSGSQDALGIVLPGLNRLYYTGEYWPSEILSIHDESILSWIENHLYLINLGPRHNSYCVLDNTCIDETNVSDLANATEECWEAILKKDLQNFGESFRKSFDAQTKMFPNMLNSNVLELINKYRNKAYGWKLSGAGGGGYLILISDKDIKRAIKITIRRKDFLF